MNGYCERRCNPNFFFYNGKCYSQCPSTLQFRTDAACVSSCPVGYLLDGKICKLNSQSCPSGQFYNNQNGVCTKSRRNANFSDRNVTKFFINRNQIIIEISVKWQTKIL